MLLPELRIGNLRPELPIIQGGMAVRISTSELAAAVANQGGIGIIAGTGMSVDELKAEIRRAKELSKGIIGVNIMFAANEFANLVATSIKEGIDLIISGAGYSRDMFTWGKESGTPIVPIVSTGRLAKLAQKMGAAAVVVEGKEAGGHLGTDESVWKLIPEVKRAVSIPVIAAGGIIDGEDIVKIMAIGADGVQMGTRFAASKESGASDDLKQLYVTSQQEDIVLVNSPVGLPGRALKNAFSHNVNAGTVAKPANCMGCLKKCSKSFCIIEALNQAQQGDLTEGLAFSGEMIHKIKEILPVKEIFQHLRSEIEVALKARRLTNE